MPALASCCLNLFQRVLEEASRTCAFLNVGILEYIFFFKAMIKNATFTVTPVDAAAPLLSAMAAGAAA